LRKIKDVSLLSFIYPEVISNCFLYDLHAGVLDDESLARKVLIMSNLTCAKINICQCAIFHIYHPFYSMSIFVNF
jgi:hypothetical protein